MILNLKTWKNDFHYFHLLQFALPNSTYYVIKGINMENTNMKPFKYKVPPQTG